MIKTLSRLELKHTLIKDRAEKRGVDFSLDMSDIEDLMKENRCFYTDAILSDKSNIHCPTRRTIDRVDSSKGYTRGNVVTSSHSANQIKNMLFESPAGEYRMTSEQFLNFAIKLDRCRIVEFNIHPAMKGLRNELTNKNRAVAKLKRKQSNLHESSERQKMLIKALRREVGEEVFFKIIEEVGQ